MKPEFRFLLMAFVLILVLVVVSPGSFVMAQATGAVAGEVKDGSGAVIPGVEVTITNTGTSVARTTLSNDNGNFRVTNLLPGNYEAKASLTGFKTAITKFVLATGDVAHIELVLEVGEVSEFVTVTDAVSAVDTEQGRVAALVDERRIVDLPLNGRDIYQLMQIAPGVVNSTSTITEPGQGASVNGGRANMNGFWMDGISSGGLSGGANITPTVDAVREFRMETLNFSAEFGASAGSVVSVVTKSGTNDYHGSIWEFHRNDNLDAREFFDSDKPEFKQNQFGFSLGGPIAKNSLFFFGSYEGTRIRTGESSLATFESTAYRNFASQYGSPVAAYLVQNYPGKPLEQVSQTVGEYLADYAWIGEATQAEVDTFAADYFGAPAGSLNVNDPMLGEASYFTPDASDTDQYSIRIDWEWGANTKIYGRYFLSDYEGTIVDSRPAFNSPQVVKSHQLGLNWTQIFSPTVVNEARAGLNRNINDIIAGDPGVPSIVEYGSGVEAWGAYNGYPQIFHENIFVYADTVSINTGNHALKMGAEFRRNQENSEFNVGRPSYYFFDLVYLALDDPYYQVGGVDPHLDMGPGNAELSSNFRGWRNTDIGIFFNDDWKVTSRLTLNLGVRWDYFSRLAEVQNRATAYDMARGGSTLFERLRAGDFIGPVDSLSSNDLNNFAPRFGFAWDIFGDGKTSLRGGYGISYNGAIYNPLANSRWNKPYYSFNLECDVCGNPDIQILYGPQDGGAVTSSGSNPNVGASKFDGNIIAYYPWNPNTAYLTGIPNPDMQDPYVQSFFLGLQREIFRDTTIEANYVGTLGRQLIRAQDWNRFTGDRLGWPSPVAGEFDGNAGLNRINPNEGRMRFWENSVNSNYHSLQLQFNKRYSSSFAVNANYTWAKSLDTRSTWHSGATSSNGAQEGYSTSVENIGIDYGRSVFDARHRIAGSVLWDAPWFRTADSWALRELIGGWQINFIFAYQSGQPFTPFTSRSFAAAGDFNADGTNNDRPNTPSSGNSFGSVDNSTWVDVNAGPFGIASNSYTDKLNFFGVPAPGTIGSLGRNTYSGPGFTNLDFALFKEFGVSKISEEAKFQLRFEFFNMGNHPNFYQPTVTLNSSTFGRSTSAFDAREIQIGLKFIF